MSVYLYSTLSNSQNVPVYIAYPGSKGGNNNSGSAKPSQKTHTIHINGGANVIDGQLITPKGVLTIIEDNEYAELRKMSCFNRWVERGFITIEKDDYDADDVAEDMTAKDGCAQITVADHDARFDSGETSADVQVDEPKKRRAPAKKRAAKKAPKATEATEE